MNRNEKLEVVKKHIKSYPDFPKKGILFRDIFSVMTSHKVFRILMELLKDQVSLVKKDIQAIVGLESRGFLLGPILALDFDVPFIPIRKKGKLPGEIISVEYSLEYGKDTFEVQKSSFENVQSVLLVDDLLATGGSLKAACNLMEKIDVHVVECLIIMELCDLEGKKQVPAKVNSLIQY